MTTTTTTTEDNLLYSIKPVPLFADRFTRSNRQFEKMQDEYRARHGGITTLYDQGPGKLQDQQTQLSQGYLSDEMKSLLSTLPDDFKGEVLKNPKLLAWVEKFLDPYDYEFKLRLVNCYENDHIVQTALDRKVDFVFGKGTSFEFKPLYSMISATESAQQMRQALEQALGGQDTKDLQNYVAKVDYMTDIKPMQKTLSAQAMVGGRAAAFIEKWDAENKFGFPEGTPRILKPLNFTFMDNVGVHPDTWDMLYVRYSDFPASRRYIATEDMLYAARSDNHVTPLSLYYGRSDLRPILALSEINRQLNEQAFAEIATKMWSGTGVWKLQSMDQSQIDAFADKVSNNPSNQIATNQLAEYLPVTVPHDLRGLLELRANNVIEILSQLKIPSPLVNRESVTNRATIDAVLQASTVSVFAQERDWWGHIMNKQWYLSLLSLWLTMNGANQSMEGTNQQADVERLAYGIFQTYQDITLETAESKAQQLVYLTQAQILQNIPIEVTLQFLGEPWSNAIEAIKMQQQQNQMMQQKAQELQAQKLQQSQQMIDKGMSPYGNIGSNQASGKQSQSQPSNA